MKKEKVTLVFDRKNRLHDEDGMGTVEIFVYLARRERKFITIGKCKRADFDGFCRRFDVQTLVNRCKDVIASLYLQRQAITVENFEAYYYDAEAGNEKKGGSKNLYKGTDQNTDFIEYFKKCLEEEKPDLAAGTYRHKLCTLTALQRYGKIKTFADLTPAKIANFDKWLHDGPRGDVGSYTYHKHLKKVISRLALTDKIPSNPYNVVPIKRGKSKERKPLTENEMVLIRDMQLTGKMNKARDLFVFAAYTGLSYCDEMAFDFKKHAVKEGKMYYIDGNRIKTGSEFYTPILPPAMAVLKKWNYQLPHISNQKVNDYLHLIQAQLGLKKNLTFHIGRHSFATLVLTHEIPMEQLARMLGHKDLKVTQIYAKILNTTIERRAEGLAEDIK